LKGCPRCFHTIGEHYLCLDHGGESGVSAALSKYKPPPKDAPCPPEAEYDYSHFWWDWLDHNPPQPRINNLNPTLFTEIIP
jgi:hypothetical protein